MRYLLTVTIREHVGSPPAELQTSMTSFVDENIRAGTFVITGGLAPDGGGVRVGLSASGVARGEPEVSIHGFAVVEAASIEHAAEPAERLLDIHRRLVPTWRVECELQPIVTHCLP